MASHTSTRRSLFAGAAGLAVSVAVESTADARGSGHEQSQWSALVRSYEAAEAKAKTLEREHAELETAAAEMRDAVGEEHSDPPAPPEITVWIPPTEFSINGGHHKLDGYSYTYSSRHDLESRCAKHPEDEYRLKAWDQWAKELKARRAEAAEAAGLVDLERREAAAEEAWHDASWEASDALDDLLRYPTLNATALAAKRRLVRTESGDSDAVLASLYAALAVGEPANG